MLDITSLTSVVSIIERDFMSVKFTATLPIMRTDKPGYHAYAHKKYWHGDEVCAPYANPLISKLLKKLKKVKGQCWNVKREGNFITITSVE